MKPKPIIEQIGPCNCEACDSLRDSLFPLLMEQKMKYDPAYLGKMYASFNSRYFGGELPGVHISEKRSKNILGAAEATVQYRNGRKEPKVPPEWVTVTGIWLSNSYNMTPEVIEKIMLHEMIHVWCYSQGIIRTFGDPSHGLEFKKKRDAIAKASGLDIPMAETKDAVEVDGVEGMIHYGAKFTEKSGKVYWLRLSKRAYDDIEGLRKFVDRYRDAKIERFVTKGSSVMFSLPERRKAEKFVSFRNPEHEKDLVNNIIKIEPI